MNISISSSKYDIIESGSVIVPEDDYIEFSFDNLRFRFVFTSNHANCEGEDSSVTGTIKEDESGSYLEIGIDGYSRIFSSPSDFLNVGQIEGKALYVYFSITPLVAKAKINKRIMIYSWYKEK